MKYRHRFLFGWLIFIALTAFGVIGVKSAHAETLADCDSLVTTPKIRQGTIGKHFMLACVPKDKSYVFEYYYLCVKGEDNCDEEKIAGAYIGALLSPGTKAAAIASFKPTWSCAAPPDQYKALCDEHAAIIKSEWAGWIKDFTPIARKYVVKANGTQTTRPGYALTAGVLGTKKVTDAPVGAQCLTDKPYTPGSGTEIKAQWVGGPDGVVTICSKGV